MKRIATYEILFSVGFKGQLAHLISMPMEMESQEWMDGDCLQDNGFRNIPELPGVYRAQAELWFEQGYNDGYPAPGESDWEFRLLDIEKVYPLEATGQPGGPAHG